MHIFYILSVYVVSLTVHFLCICISSIKIIYTKYLNVLVIILITWCPPIGWCPRALAQSRLWIIRPCLRLLVGRVHMCELLYYLILYCTVKKCNDSPTQLNHIRCYRVHLIQNVSLLHWFWLHCCGWCMYNNLLCTNWVQQLCHIESLAHNSGHN